MPTAILSAKLFGILHFSTGKMKPNVELGPIRPPSEHGSLLLRITRGCHWNRCFFCGLYKGMQFSIRPTKEIVEDIKNYAAYYGIRANYFSSCFLQDGDAFNIPTKDLLNILHKLKEHFPSLQTITTYSRCDSILKKSQLELQDLQNAGLNHLYIGIETGSDTILKKINKGITALQIVESGLRAKKAGIALSYFTLLGIGGKTLSKENAIETAKVINTVNPEFIRVHHTAFKPNTKLGRDVEKGLFELQSEEEIVQEQKLFIENLSGITSSYINEHAVNLLLEVRGRFPDDKKNMLNTINRYLEMTAEEKLNFAVGRRMGIYYYLEDMQNKSENASVKKFIAENSKIDFTKFCNDCRAKMI